MVLSYTSSRARQLAVDCAGGGFLVRDAELMGQCQEDIAALLLACLSVSVYQPLVCRHLIEPHRAAWAKLLCRDSYLSS